MLSHANQRGILTFEGIFLLKTRKQLLLVVRSILIGVVPITHHARNTKGAF